MDCRGGFPSRGAGFPGGRGCWGGRGGRGAGGHGGRGGMFGFGHPHFGFDQRFDPRFGFGGPAAGGHAAPSATHCPLGYGSAAGFQGGHPWGPEVGVAGLRGLLTHAAPYLQRIVGDIDEQMIEQAIQASLAETGPQNGIGQQFKETVTVDKSGEKEMYRVDIILGGDAKAESLKIKRKDNVVTIDVKTETSAEDASSRLYQEYTRRITLPENVDLTQLESALSPDGVLTIKAPLFPKPEEAIQSVPIAVVTLD